jgi:hypothetical protein
MLPTNVWHTTDVPNRWRSEARHPSLIYPWADGLTEAERVMSIFGGIMSKIFSHGSAAVVAAGQSASPPSAPAAAPSAAPAAPAQSVDVGAVLAEMASMKGGGGNYQTSIADLLRLLDLDSSLDARNELANELNVHVGADGSAEENIALHRAVIEKLAANGGVIPDSLRS